MAKTFEADDIHGFLHEADGGAGLVLTHGAGGNCNTPLLIAMAEAFAAGGVTVLRFDLAFRRKRAFGPPHPSFAAADRESIRHAVRVLRAEIPAPVYVGGHSYGGRQATMLAAEDANVTEGLLLLSYPLHPPNKPEQLRTAHFPSLRTPAVFVHGDRDPFGTIDEMRSALALIPARTKLIPVAGAEHDLKRGRFDLAGVINAVAETIGAF